MKQTALRKWKRLLTGNLYRELVVTRNTLQPRSDAFLSEIINQFNDRIVENHFSAIRLEHPDFDDIAASPKYKKWVSSLTIDLRVIVNRVNRHGTARQVILVLSAFKAAEASEIGSCQSLIRAAGLICTA